MPDGSGQDLREIERIIFFGFRHLYYRLKGGLAEMNLKVANLIAVQLGIFVGIMSWLVFSHLESTKPRTAAEMQNSTGDSSATVAPVFEPRNQRPYTVDYETNHERAQPVDEEAAPTAQEYDQEIATQPYTSSGLGNGYVAADSPSYAEVDQEPAVAQPDYVPSPQIVVYAQPAQIVIFSNPRRFANRFRSTPHFDGARMMIMHRRPDRVGPHLGGNGIGPRRNPNAPSGRPAQGFGLRGNR